MFVKHCAPQNVPPAFPTVLAAFRKCLLQVDINVKYTWLIQEISPYFGKEKISILNKLKTSSQQIEQFMYVMLGCEEIMKSTYENLITSFALKHNLCEKFIKEVYFWYTTMVILLYDEETTDFPLKNIVLTILEAVLFKQFPNKLIVDRDQPLETTQNVLKLYSQSLEKLDMKIKSKLKDIFDFQIGSGDWRDGILKIRSSSTNESYLTQKLSVYHSLEECQKLTLFDQEHFNKINDMTNIPLLPQIIKNKTNLLEFVKKIISKPSTKSSKNILIPKAYQIEPESESIKFEKGMIKSTKFCKEDFQELDDMLISPISIEKDSPFQSDWRKQDFNEQEKSKVRSKSPITKKKTKPDLSVKKTVLKPSQTLKKIALPLKKIKKSINAQKKTLKSSKTNKELNDFQRMSEFLVEILHYRYFYEDILKTYQRLKRNLKV